jgi:putative transposase
MTAISYRNSFMSLNEVYFWTSTITEWRHLLKEDHLKQIIINSLENLANRKLVAVYAFVIMPNHIHLIWELLSMNGKEFPDSSFSKYTAHCFKKELTLQSLEFLELFKSEKYDRDYEFWQRDPMAIKILNKEMLLQKLQYIHLNPLKEHWSLASMPEDYQWSSAKYYECDDKTYNFITL